MLFWLTLGITLTLFIGVMIFAYKSSVWDEKYKEADCAYDALPYSAHEKRVQLRQERSEASEKYNEYDTIASWFLGFCIGIGCILLIMSLILLISYSCAPSKEAYLVEEYNAYTAQIEHEYFSNEYGDTLGSKELMDAVIAYNAELRADKHWEKNFWVGIFYPNIYSDKPLIEIP